MHGQGLDRVNVCFSDDSRGLWWELSPGSDGLQLGRAWRAGEDLREEMTPRDGSFCRVWSEACRVPSYFRFLSLSVCPGRFCCFFLFLCPLMSGLFLFPPWHPMDKPNTFNIRAPSGRDKHLQTRQAALWKPIF